MKNIAKIILPTLASFLLAAPAWSTIYLVASDAATGSVGMAVISSGPVATYDPSPISGVKGVGFVGWSGAADNVSPEVNEKVFGLMRDSATAAQIETYVDSQIHDLYSRYSFISVQGVIGYVFPPNGCAEPECGEQTGQSQKFFIMGGGLKPHVVPGAVKIYETKIEGAKIPFECKLLSGLGAIIEVGGEIKEFNEAVIGVDQPTHAAQEWFKSSSTGSIIDNLKRQIAATGINCQNPMTDR